MNKWVAALCVVVITFGMIKLLGLLLGLLSSFKRHCCRMKQDVLKRYGGPGTWAVVTGASDGIGAECCRQLAKDGFNIILVSRTQAKLDDVEQELKSIAPDIETLVIQADFSGNSNMDFYQGIASKIGGRDIGLLVLNAGLSAPGRLGNKPGSHF